MNINELEQKLKEDNLLTVHDGDVVIKYVNGGKVYYDEKLHNMRNVFGIYKKISGKFCFFITDDERGGIPKISSNFKTEEEACNVLYEVIARKERIYQDSIK